MKGSVAARMGAIALVVTGWTMTTLAADKATRPRAREVGLTFGILPTGRHNAITDVSGVRVGHRTRIEGDNIRTGVTVVIPGDDVFQRKIPAAIYVANGFGKLAGSTQVQELGNLETPIALTNTLGVPTAMQALIRYTLALPGNEQVRSVNALVGETNDGRLNDIRGLHLRESDVVDALRNASGGPVAEGNVGAGTGTVAFGFKGGIGTSSRVLPSDRGGYTVGVLVQANYGGVLRVNGTVLGKELGTLAKHYGKYAMPTSKDVDGSCMIIVATDAPLDAHRLQRLAKRAVLGLAQTGSYMSNGSGDYVIAFSTAYRIPYGTLTPVPVPALVHNNSMSDVFLAVTEATEEALINALFRAETMKGYQETEFEAIPIDRVVELIGQGATKPNR